MGKVKIISTIGPSSLEETIIKKMDDSGVDLFRINLSHTCIDDLIPIAKDLGRLEAKIDAIYEECKLRDSAIYRAVLEMREIVTGLQTINERNSIAEL